MRKDYHESSLRNIFFGFSSRCPHDPSVSVHLTLHYLECVILCQCLHLLGLLELFQADVDEFCQYYGRRDAGLCFPDFQRKQPQDSNYFGEDINRCVELLFLFFTFFLNPFDNWVTLYIILNRFWLFFLNKFWLNVFYAIFLFFFRLLDSDSYNFAASFMFV